MKKLVAIFFAVVCLGTAQAQSFNATDSVEAYFRYGTEWYDSSGNIQAWTYLEVARWPWDGTKYWAYWAGKACCGFWQDEIHYDITDPIEFPWPPSLISVPDIDPAWSPVTVDCAWAYDYPDYVINGGWPTYLCGYAGGDIWVDAQSGEILEAFGSQPSWWPAPLAVESPKINHGKHLGHSK